MKSKLVIFFATFLVAFIIQTSYYQAIYLGDNDLWVQRLQNLSDDILRAPVHIDFKDSDDKFRYGAHPGTSIILPAAIFYRLGADPQKSLINTVALLNAFLIATTTLVCFKLRPKSPWYISTGIILSIHPLYFYGSPINVIIATATALMFLLALSIYENRNKPTLKYYLISFAAATGLGLATRLPITVIIAAPLFSFISAYINVKKVILTILIALFTAFILNPFLWLIPIEYMSTIILRTATHVVHVGIQVVAYTPALLIYYSPITPIAITFISILLFLPSYKPPVSRPFLITLILITGLVMSILFGSGFKTLRYLYPIIFTWDILFPLFLLHSTKHFDFSFLRSPQKQAKALFFTRLIVLTIIILSFSYLTCYNLSFPNTNQGLI
jgi:4-amino-4-deoxy-L-arabinose transferase-like glycosyltransferase